MKIPRIAYSALIVGVAIAATGAVIVHNASAKGEDHQQKQAQTTPVAPGQGSGNLSVSGFLSSLGDGPGDDHQSQPAATGVHSDQNGTHIADAENENEDESAEHGPSGTPPPQATPVPGSITITGPITGANIVVNGQSISINQNTRIEGLWTPGAQVQVTAVQQADGSLLALVIKFPSPQTGDRDGNEREGEHHGTPPPPTGTPAPTPTPVPGATPTPTPQTVSYSATIQPILNANCVSCHGGTAGVTLSSYASTILTVTPGNAAASRLYTKISTGHGGLTAAQIQSIADWINQGALHN